MKNGQNRASKTPIGVTPEAIKYCVIDDSGFVGGERIGLHLLRQRENERRLAEGRESYKQGTQNRS